MEVCVIGVGPLGRRHAEGALMSGKCNKLTIVDRSVDALNVARTFLNELQENDIGQNVKIDFIQKYEHLSLKYDVLIISTTAQHRLSAIEDFLNRSHTDFMLLEKVLFVRIVKS